MIEILLRPAVLAPVTLLVAYTIYTVWQAILPSNLPDLPVVGAKSSDWLPLLQARWRNSKNYRDVANEINTLYKNKPCLVPIGGSETVVLLPASEAQHIVDQPDSVLNMPQPIIDGLQFKYTVKDQVILEEPLHLKIVSGKLTHQISNLLGDMREEVQWGLDKHWGNDDTEFKEFPVFDTLRRIIGSVTNRVFVGLPTGRDPNLVESGMSYAAALPQEAGKIRLYPGFLKPLIARYYTARTRAHTKAFYDILKPEINQRLREYEEQQVLPEKDRKPARNDLLGWSIEQAKEHHDPRMSDPDTLAGRVLMLNFAAIHTTSFTSTYVVFDLFSSTQDNVDELREEISHVLAQNDGQWNKTALYQMEKLDSLVRETLRLDSASTFGIPRLVIGKNGMITRSGAHVPRGNIVAVPGKNIARDEAFYVDAETYKPFRFAETRMDTDVAYLQRAKQAAPTTSAEFLSFGHGKHACPGRFFAVAQLKLLLGHIIMYYDIEMLEERPSDIFVGVAKLPPLTSKVKLRRRQNV